VAPPHERSARPGDGQWSRLGDATAHDRAGEGEPLLYRTVVHPHPVSRWHTVTVVAIDLQRARVHLLAGSEDPKSKTAPPELRTGLVPSEHHDSLVAVFNGGWKTVHGSWGVMLAGHTFVPPKKEGCTIALMKDGSARIGAWPELEAAVAEMDAFRQTPPCLVEDGALHRLLAAKQEHPWGGMEPNIKTRQRSALGVDSSGRILFYAYGEEVGAALLAEGLRAVGAVDAAELDINFIWVRFLLFGKPPPDGVLRVTSTLIPKMAHEKGGYISRPYARDFFYVRRL
jgi:hypothetical protein